MKRVMWIPALAMILACQDRAGTNPVGIPTSENGLTATADRTCYNVSGWSDPVFLPVICGPDGCTEWTLTDTVHGDIEATVVGSLTFQNLAPNGQASRWDGEVVWTVTSSTVPDLEGRTLTWSLILHSRNPPSGSQGEFGEGVGQSFLIGGARSGYLAGGNNTLTGHICP